MDLLNRVTHGKGLEMTQQIPAEAVHLAIAEIECNTISQLGKHWEVYNRILADMSVVIIAAHNRFSEQVIMSNTELFRYRVSWSTIADIYPLPACQKELFIFTNRAPAYQAGSDYGTPYYQKSHIAEKQAERVEKGLNRAANLSLYVSRQTQTILFNDTSNLQPFSLLRWLIRNYSNFGDVVFNCANPLIPYAAILEGRQFISIVPERKGKFAWDIDLVDFWDEQMSLL